MLDPNSVVNFMKARGFDSSLANRKRIASVFGILGEPGSASWNTALRDALQKM